MSEEEDLKQYFKRASLLIWLATGLLVFALIIIPLYSISPTVFEFKTEPEVVVIAPVVNDADRIENGIHVRTGLVEGEGLMTVVNNCTSCHSSKIIIQNRMDTDGWNSTIEWMQETQNLWDLGKNQEVIVNYLVTNYPLKDKGRREILSDIEWYEL